MRMFAILGVVVFSALVLGAPQTATCDNCIGQCSESLPCAGADCGCVQREGQPFGVCRPY